MAATAERVDIWGSHRGRTFELGYAVIAEKGDFTPLINLLRKIADQFEAADAIDRLRGKSEDRP